MESYLTLSGEGVSEVLIKGSRFLGWAGPAADPEDAAAAVDRARSRWPHANHHAYAYRLRDGDGRIRYRSSDDGEPGGTAGRPLYRALDGPGICNAAVVTSRIFGGIKLGAGGLARAYGRAAREAVDAAGRVLLPVLEDYRLVIPAIRLGIVEAFLQRGAMTIEDRRVEGEDVALGLRLQDSKARELAAWLAGATGGTARLMHRGAAGRSHEKPRSYENRSDGLGPIP